MDSLRTLTRYELALTGLVVLGVALRMVMTHRWPVVYDGGAIATTRWFLLQNRDFLVPYTKGVAHYRHCPPLYPPTWPSGTPASGSLRGRRRRRVSPWPARSS